MFRHARPKTFAAKNEIGALFIQALRYVGKDRVAEGDRLILTEGKDGFFVTPYDDTFADAMKACQETRRKYLGALRELAE